jgi:hypothetical protein
MNWDNTMHSVTDVVDHAIANSHTPRLVLAICSIPPFLSLYRYILRCNESQKQNTCVADPILEILPTYDTSAMISVLSTMSTIVFVYGIFEDPKVYPLIYTAGHLVFVFFAVSLLRMLSIIICPLRQHKDGILLRDYFVETVVGDTMSTRHDLMFSGHVAQQVLYLYYVPKYTPFFHVMLIGICVALMLGKIHYTIDIFVAFFVTHYVCNAFPLSG